MIDRKKRMQEEQYSYPYHYIPTWGDGGFSQTQHWSWGFRYIGGMKVVIDQLESLSFRSLVDIGCGDGRFLRELRKRYPEIDTLGVDYSDRAINLARAMNPNLTFEPRDITTNPINKSFDVATLIEVLEHIPPDDLGLFISEVRKLVVENGHLILTVPHSNKSVQEKHYQHFDSQYITRLVTPHFYDLEIIPFDARSRLLSVLVRVLGGKGDHFVLTNDTINRMFMRLYIDNFLYDVSESNCGRLAVVGKAKPM